MPIEIISDGLYLSYFQVIILFLFCKHKSKVKIVVFLCYSASIITSILLSSDVVLTSLVNPILTGLALIIFIDDKNQLEMIKNGIYISAIGNTIFLLILAYQKDINSIFILLTSRDWAVAEMPYFGNGLAMLFSAAMLLAFRENKIKLAVIFFIGGLLTTSRIPILVFAILLILSIFRIFKIRIILLLIVVGIFLIFSLIFSDFGFIELSRDQADLLLSRMSTTEDRQDVYELAIAQMYNHPFFGAGSQKLDFYEHAHNSYLQVIYKYGIVTFPFWIFLIYLAFFKNLKFLRNIDFILFFLIISSSQIGLQNPNLVLVIVVYRQILRDNALNKVDRINQVSALS